MNAPHEPVAQPAPSRGPGRRIAAMLVVSTIVFLVLWLTAFTAITSLLVASAACIVVVVVGAASDPIGTVLDAIAGVVLAVFGVIAAIVAAIFSIFDF
jgi:hypothetical protein